MKFTIPIEIPPGHVLHWKITGGGIEVEYLRFLTPGQAKNRSDRPNQRRKA